VLIFFNSSQSFGLGLLFGSCIYSKYVLLVVPEAALRFISKGKCHTFDTERDWQTFDTERTYFVHGVQKVFSGARTIILCSPMLIASRSL